MVQSSCSVKNGKLNETIEVSALWSNIIGKCFVPVMQGDPLCQRNLI